MDAGYGVVNYANRMARWPSSELRNYCSARLNGGAREEWKAATVADDAANVDDEVATDALLMPL